MKRLVKQLLLCGIGILSSVAAEAQIGMGTWTNTGPVNFPINVSGQVHGIGRVSQIKFHNTNPQKMYAVSASGGLYISNNNGATWAPTPGTEQFPQTSCSAVCIDNVNDSVIYLSSGDADYYGNGYGIWKSTDAGATYALANNGMGNRMCVEIFMHPNDRNTLVAATRDGIWKTTNAAGTWTNKQSGGQFRDMKQKPGSISTLYAVTATQFFRSTDFGDTWTQITSGVTIPSGNGGMRIAVSAADTNVVYLVTTGSNGVVMKSTDGGSNFTTVYNSTTQCLVCYDANPTSGSQGNYNIDLNANPLNANELLLVAHNVWRSTDGGATWSKRTSWWNEVHTDMHQIEFNPYNNTQIFNANDGGVWMSTDTLKTIWSPRSDGLAATEIYRAAQSPVLRQTISIGTQDNGELFYDGIWKCNRGGDWTSKCIIDYSSSGPVYYLASGKRRNLAPLAGEQSYNSPFTATQSSDIEFVKDKPNVAFLGKDTLWRSTNINTSSPTWTYIIPNTETIRDIVSCTADTNVVYFVTNANHLYRSDNALSTTPTYTMLTTPGSTSAAASIATNKNNANIVYLSCNNALYVSTNKGANWTAITGNLPNLNIRRVIHDDYSTNERLFVSLGGYVYLKDNTTTTWTNHSTNQGLPSVANVSDFMIYNNGTAASILRLSTYGRGVWECPIYNNLVPATDFVANKQFICPGDTVRFTKTSYGTVTSQSWSFPGGSPATSTKDTVFVVYNTPGVYNATYAATNTAGTNNNTKTAYINVSYGSKTNVTEGFEGSTYPPLGWQQGTTNYQWATTTAANGYGTSVKCIMFDNFNTDAQGKRAIIQTPKIDLTNVSAARLTFDVAYAPYSTAYPDSLVIQLSTNCGKTFTPVYTKTGATLGTAPAKTDATFVPSSIQWRTDTVVLNSYTGNSIQLSFENIGKYGQALYIDNVNISMSPYVKFGASDTAVCTGETIQFSDSTINTTSHSWSFPGGTPNASTANNPVITYSTPGVYNVSLFSSNSFGTTTKTWTNYVRVNALPVVSITPTGFKLKATGAKGTFSWFYNGTLIAGATDSIYTATKNGSYRVYVVDSNGCSDTSEAYNVTGVGIRNINKNAVVQVYPNPANEVVYVKAEDMEAKTATIIITNMTGAVVYKQTATVKNGTLDAGINTTAFARGVYQLKLQTDTGHRIIKSITLQ